MLSRDVKRILEENMKYTKMLEEYDRRREFALNKIRRSFTIRKGTYWKLREASKITGKPMSAIVDELVERSL